MSSLLPAFNPQSSAPLGGLPPWGVWRDGKYVVLYRGEELPSRCVKSNGVATDRIVTVLYWHPRWLFSLILLGLIPPCLQIVPNVVVVWLLSLIFAGLLPTMIVTSIVQKKATINIPVGKGWQVQRIYKMLIAIAMEIASITLVILPILGYVKTQGWVIPGILGLILAMFLHSYFMKPLGAHKIDEHYVWLSGACPAYLDSLPQFPGEIEALHRPMPTCEEYMRQGGPTASSPMPPPLPPQ